MCGLVGVDAATASCYYLYNSLIVIQRRVHGGEQWGALKNTSVDLTKAYYRAHRGTTCKGDGVVPENMDKVIANRLEEPTRRRDGEDWNWRTVQ